MEYLYIFYNNQFITNMNKTYITVKKSLTQKKNGCEKHFHKKNGKRDDLKLIQVMLTNRFV